MTVEAPFTPYNTETYLAYPEARQPAFVHLPRLRHVSSTASSSSKRARTSANPSQSSTLKLRSGVEGSTADQTPVFGDGSSEEGVASLYLKGVAQGISRASPDLCIPISTLLNATGAEDAMSRCPDYIVQVLDPQATVSRRRSVVKKCAGGSNLDPSALPGLPATPHDVWVGSGLLSWALDEDGDGKTMIKGKLVRDVMFPLVKSEGSLSVREQDERLSDVVETGGLDALVQLEKQSRSEASCGDDHNVVGTALGGWGVEITIRLKPMLDAPPLSLLPPATDRKINSRAGSSTPSRHPSEDVASSSTVFLSTPHQTRYHEYPTISWSSPSVAFATPGFDPDHLQDEVFGNRSTAAHLKRKAAVPLEPRKRVASELPPSPVFSEMRPTSRLGVRPQHGPIQSERSSGELKHVQVSGCAPSPREVPLEDNPSTETSTEAAPDRMDPKAAAVQPADGATEASPSMVAGVQRATAETSTRKKTGKKKIAPRPGIFCSNCGRTETCTWRQRNDQRVCNACGIYWNVHKRMRPKELWGRSKKGKRDSLTDKENQPQSSDMTPLQKEDGSVVQTPSRDDSVTSRSSNKAVNPRATELAALRTRRAEAFKRTMSAIVEREAERIKAKRALASHGDGKSGHKPTSSRANATSSLSRPTETAAAISHAMYLHAPSMLHPGTSMPNGALPTELSADATACSPSANPWTEALGSLGISDEKEGFDRELFHAAIRQLAAAEAEGDPTLQEDADVDLSAWFKFSQSQSTSASQETVKNGGGNDALDNDEDPFAFFDALLPEDTDTSAAVVEATDPSPERSPFDFSQLPPSSPPITTRDLQHSAYSALLLSSPGTSPNGLSPWSDSAPSPASTTPAATETHVRRSSGSMWLNDKSGMASKNGRHPLASVAALGQSGSVDLEQPTDAKLVALLAEYGN